MCHLLSAHQLRPQVSIGINRESPATWNRFAALCGASFRASYYASRAWQWDHHFLQRLRRFSCFIEQDGREIKIAQAAIGFGRQRRVFAEGLMILPEYQFMWSHVMASLLAHLGAGEYHYGSPWSLEPPRESELLVMPGVAVVSVQSITVYAVDFTRWSCWTDYLKDVSLNARRNAKRAEKEYVNGLLIRTRSSLASLKDISHLLSLRRSLYARKKIPFSLTKNALRFALRTVVMRHDAFTTVLRVRGIPAAAFGGVVFGPNTYYLESGALKQNNGASWLLTLRTLRDAYERAPNGRFVTGFHRADTVVDPGLDFFRSQCCAIGSLTTEVLFRYAPAR